MSSRLCPGGSGHRPAFRSPWTKLASAAVPSTMDASTTWPRAGPGGGQQRADHAEGEHHAAAAHVAEQVHRRHRPVAGPPAVVQRAGQRDVADVVPGDRREWTVLAPAGHPAVHQRRVDRVAVGRPEPEPLGDARPEPLQQHVGRGHQVEHDLPAVRVLEVDPDGPPAAQQDVRVRAGLVVAHVGGALDPDHVGTGVGEHHRRERAGPDPGQLDHPHPARGPVTCQPNPGDLHEQRVRLGALGESAHRLVGGRRPRTGRRRRAPAAAGPRRRR